MNLFETVKKSVTTRQAAERYGIRVNRNGMAVCPFHNDKNPSMKVDNRFHCFGCQADGDVIDFTSRLFDLKVKDAAEKLAIDFSVSYDSKGHSPPRKKIVKQKISEEVRFKQAEQRCRCALFNYLHLLINWKIEYEPKLSDTDWHPLFEEALENQTYIEYLLDILMSGTTEEKALLIAKHGKDVIQIEQRVSEFTQSYSAGY